MRHVQVRLEDDEYKQFKGKADRSGMDGQEAGKKALMAWAEPKAGPPAFTDLGEVEHAVLCAVLELLRNEAVPSDDPSTVKPSLLAMGKRWLRRNRE